MCESVEIIKIVEIVEITKIVKNTKIIKIVKIVIVTIFIIVTIVYCDKNHPCTTILFLQSQQKNPKIQQKDHHRSNARRP